MLLQIVVEARDVRVGDQLQIGPELTAKVTASGEHHWREGHGLWLDGKVDEFGHPLDEHGDLSYSPDIALDPHMQLVVLRLVG